MENRINKAAKIQYNTIKGFTVGRKTYVTSSSKGSGEWNYIWSVKRWVLHALCTVYTAFGPCELLSCRNRAHSVSWPEVIKGIPNQGVGCSVNFFCMCMYLYNLQCIRHNCELITKTRTLNIDIIWYLHSILNNLHLSLMHTCHRRINTYFIVLYCFLVFGCQYQHYQLPGKTRLRNDLLCRVGH